MYVFQKDMDKELFFCIIILALFFNFVSFSFIRHLIWSIAWCDIGGKERRVDKLQRTQNLISRLNMRYLQNYTNKHRQEFLFWITIKSLHNILSFIFIVISVIITMIYPMIEDFANFYSIFFCIGSFALCLILAFQFDINRNTKYDKERKNRK